MKITLIVFAFLSVVACAGMKVVDPRDQENKGTMALDTSGGGLKLVETYTCRLSAMGKTFSAVAKSESEARKEATARCQDNTVISNCNGSMKCFKN